jgi:putative peptide zinc metalloprotease protein
MKLTSKGILEAGLPACPPQRVPDVTPMREDLQLFPAAANHDGSPAWMIQDPVSNRFFRIGWVEFELLSRWHLGNPALIIMSTRRETALPVTADDLNKVSEFLRQHQLVRVARAQDTDFLASMADKQDGSRLNWLLHNYLFFRLPLVRPTNFLKFTLPFVSFAFSRLFLCFTLFCTVLGIFLVTRQWDTFAHTFTDFVSLKGFAGFAAALAFAKCLHELGHAYTATRYGVRVAHMGVAFLVMWPMLYTDTSESWKLLDRKQRFKIAAAGIVAELALAGFSTLAWALADDGALRSALFFLATASWVITLGINASPFMRFDGYFLLSDALDMPNLHLRSGAFARTWMRRNLLGWSEPWPEAMPSGARAALIGFALFTWSYRLILFLGIAAAVYFFFFKLLGILLFVVEIAWFIVKPVWSELKVWVEKRGQISKKAIGGWLLFFVALGLVLFIPWRSDIHAPGLLRSEQQTIIYSPLPARVAQIHPMGPVKAGEIITVLESPDAKSKANQSAVLAQSLALQLDQTIGRSDGLDSRAVILEQLGERLAEVDAQNAEIARLALRAAYDGLLLDTDPLMAPGVWINGSQPIGVLVDPKAWVVEVLVEQRDLERVAVGSTAQFYKRGMIETPLAGKVISIDSTRTQVLPHAMLATDHGGRIAAARGTADSAISSEGKGSGLVPRDSLYKVRIKLDSTLDVNNKELFLMRTALQSGTAVIEGQARSLGLEWFKTIAAVFVRESGF